MNKTTPSAKSMSQPLSIRRVRVFIFFGGPSNERNISLDSARSFYDSIRERLQPRSITLIFISPAHRFYIVKPEWIYCNTIEDFEALILNNKTPPPTKVSCRQCHQFRCIESSSKESRCLRSLCAWPLW